MDHNPMHRLGTAIARKAERLPAYVQAVGPDVRLQLVADRQFNSGKLMLDGSAALDPRGFGKVYFMSHPESVVVFE